MNYPYLSAYQIDNTGDFVLLNFEKPYLKTPHRERIAGRRERIAGRRERIAGRRERIAGRRERIAGRRVSPDKGIIH